MSTRTKARNSLRASLNSDVPPGLNLKTMNRIIRGGGEIRRKGRLRRLNSPNSKPKFEGGDPRGWILKAEKYFRYYQTPKDLKVDVAAMYLEGDALDLFS